jgi:hypothetical protein
MSRGGHNWRGTGTVEGTRSLDVMKLARAGYLTDSRVGTWQLTNRDGATANIGVVGGRDSITLDYRVRSGGDQWQSVNQRAPIRWTPCRFGGQRPWFVCNVRTNGIYCGRQVAKLYVAGRFFACRHCYRLGYAVQRCRPMNRAHHRLGRLHRKLGGDYDGPDGIPPKPKRMWWQTYSRIAWQIEAGAEYLDLVFTLEAQRILARIDRSEQRGASRR